MAQIHPDQVAIYIRWSTEDQGQGHTLQIQQESCRYYCLSQGWTPLEQLTFIDDGYSGSTLQRPALARLRQAVQAGQVSGVVVYKLDRLSRNVRDIINLVLDEWEERCSVRSTQEPVDTTSDAGRMFFTMLGSFADFERSSIKSRTWSGKRKNAEQGKNPGMGYPYGFVKSETGGWGVCETEAVVVRQIFAWYIEGGSCRRIAAELNRQGLRSRSGRTWADGDISRLLRNPLYAGRLLYNRRAYARKAKVGKVLPKEASEVITCEGAAPAIVAPAVWEAASQVRAGRPRLGRAPSSGPGAASAKAPRAHSSPHLLSGLLTCRCGRSWVTFQGGKRQERFYVCAGARTGGAAVCASRSIKAETLEARVLAEVRTAWPLTEEFRAEWLEGAPDQAEALAARTRELGLRRRSLEAALGRFKSDYKAGRLPAEEYAGLTAETRADLAQCQQSLAAAEGQRQKLVRPTDLDSARRLHAELDPWAALGPEGRQQVLRHLLERIAVHRPRGSRDLTFQLHWRLDPAACQYDQPDAEASRQAIRRIVGQSMAAAIRQALCDAIEQPNH